jgi:hypothetical protein
LPIEHKEREPAAAEIHATGSVSYLEHGLALAERLAAHAYTRALALALDALGDLQVAPAATAHDQAHLRALGSLYLLAQLESASLLPSVELLAGIGISGGIQADLGPAAGKLMQFWRHRSERFSADERRHLFDQLFDSDFDNFMISLCEALYKLDEGVSGVGVANPMQEAKVRTLAQQLAEHLLNHTNGESAFAADAILAQTREATEILKDPHVQHAFGANTIWKTVDAISRRYGKAQADSASFVVRGKAGLTILSWLADALSVMGNSAQPLVALDHPVIGAAVDWLQTSLTIEQNKADHTSRPEGA